MGEGKDWKDNKNEEIKGIDIIEIINKNKIQHLKETSHINESLENLFIKRRFLYNQYYGK